MSLTNDTELFSRVATKKQKNLMLSRELIGVLDAHADEGQLSQEVERALWRALIEEHGRESVAEAIQDVQEDLDGHTKLAEPKPFSLPA